MTIVNVGQPIHAVSITGGDYNTIVDANHGSSQANHIRDVTLTDTGVVGQYAYVAIQSSALRQLTLIGVKQGIFVDAVNRTAHVESMMVNGMGPGYVSSQGAWLEDNNVTAMNFHAVGAASQMYIQATWPQTITFRNDASLSLTDFVVSSSLKSVAIASPREFSTSMTQASQITINATLSTGDVTLTLAAGQTYTGGSGADVIDLVTPWPACRETWNSCTARSMATRRRSRPAPRATQPRLQSVTQARLRAGFFTPGQSGRRGALVQRT